MSNLIETVEIKRFYASLIQEVQSIQITEEEGGALEQIFTQWAVDLLAGGGETENARVAYDEKALGTKNQHKINAYSISDNYETIDLFITIFKGGDSILRIAKDEIDTAAKRIGNFLRKGIYKDYVNEIEESSPIFDFAQTLSNSSELKQSLVRVNAIILTDGFYSGETPLNQNISGYPVYYRIIDVEYLFNISEKVHIPIEIDFKLEGFEIPCIVSPSENDQYQSYLAIIPGTALANIYERFGSRLLEQNVRSFLQFSGKINKGIRNTILKESYMFLAFNNGIAATAEEIEIRKSRDGYMITKVKDFQIVNGGQTTASIYHTSKKDKADISGVSVQLKISVVKNKEKFSEIVSRISEYANTQNKVSVSDLSSNTPYHIDIEKLSRSIVAPHVQGQSHQTRWFYERARGQYKNARIKEGFTKAKQKAFDLKNPKNQMFTKEDLAKYVNAYHELYDGKKLVIGPHFVVRGNQKNYVQFINYNLTKSPDSIYYEDVIAKSILFRTAEKLYGVKPNSIGDMRYITVPYTISLLSNLTDNKLDLYKVWRSQAISEQLKKLLYSLMKQIESFIKENAPGALYGEWAKKEDCWIEIKKQEFKVDLMLIQNDLEDSKSQTQRRRMTDEDTAVMQENDEIQKIRSVPPEVWRKIEDWGRLTGLLTHQQSDVAYNLRGRVRSSSVISDRERRTGIMILDTVIGHAPEILVQIDERQPPNQPVSDGPEVTLDLVKKMVEWDKKNKKLKDHHFKFMLEIVKGKTTLDEQAKRYAMMNYKTLLRLGFKD
jgi:hypothetical protein